jgi:hypothetical protein
MKDLRIIFFSIPVLIGLYKSAEYLTGLYGEIVGNLAWYVVFWLPLGGFIFWLALWSTSTHGVKMKEVERDD